MKKSKPIKRFPNVLYAYLDPEGDYVFAEVSLEDLAQSHLVGQESSLIGIYDLRSTYRASTRIVLEDAK